MKYLSVTKSLWALINNEDDFKLFICLKSQVSKNERFPHSLNEHFHFQFLFRNMVQNFLVLAGKEEAATKIYCWIFLGTMVAWLFTWHFKFSYIWIIKVSQCDQGSGIRQNIHNTELNVYVLPRTVFAFPKPNHLDMENVCVSITTFLQLLITLVGSETAHLWLPANPEHALSSWGHCILSAFPLSIAPPP